MRSGPLDLSKRKETLEWISCVRFKGSLVLGAFVLVYLREVLTVQGYLFG